MENDEAVLDDAQVLEAVAALEMMLDPAWDEFWRNIFEDPPNPPNPPRTRRPGA